MFQNDQDDHFGLNDLIPSLIWELKWTKMIHLGPFWPEEVHFGPFRSANCTLAIPDESPIWHCAERQTLTLTK